MRIIENHHMCRGKKSQMYDREIIMALLKAESGRFRWTDRWCKRLITVNREGNTCELPVMYPNFMSSSDVRNSYCEIKKRASHLRSRQCVDNDKRKSFKKYKQRYIIDISTKNIFL